LKKKKQTIFVHAILFVTAFILAMTAQTGCVVWPDSQLPLSSANETPFSSQETTRSATSIQVPSGADSIRETTAAATSTPEQTSQILTFTEPSPEFDCYTTALILAGLQDRTERINLDPLLEKWSIREEQIEDCIDHVYVLYTDLYLKHPEFFYLSGSFEVHYSVLQGLTREVAGLQIEPAYWSTTADLSSDQLDELIRSVNQVAINLAESIRRETDQPREQMIRIHDWLVQNITYDETLDQGNNHAGQALLDRKTLCQGYAQSFQLIAQQLGLDVRLIMGESEGIGHVWNQVTLNSKTYHVDVTHDDPTPDGGPDDPVSHVHLFRSDAVMSETHQWDNDRYPACPEDGAFYYTDRGLAVSSRQELIAQLDAFVDSIDLASDQSQQLELLLFGQPLSGPDDLTDLVTEALKNKLSGGTVYYRANIKKGVAYVQVSSQS
jgi:transglutaminase-like putative cysteine protease